MKLALQYEMQRPSLDDHLVLQETMEQCILADEVGFDVVLHATGHDERVVPVAVAVRRSDERLRLAVVREDAHVAQVHGCRHVGTFLPSG